MYTGVVVIVLIIIMWFACVKRAEHASGTLKQRINNVKNKVTTALGFEQYNPGVQWVGNSKEHLGPSVGFEQYNPGVQWVGNSKEHYNPGVQWVGNSKEHYNTKLSHQAGAQWAGANTPSGLDVGTGQGVGQGTLWQGYM